jgi:Carbohydrate family 9 binding domain-like
MRLNFLEPGPVLVGCALLTLISCRDDQPESESLLAPSDATLVSAYDIVKVSTITIDGNLGEWSNIAPISMQDPNTSRGSLRNTASVKLAWDDTYLYAAFDVTDTDVRAVQTIRDHGDLHRDDHIELYVDPQGDGAGAASMTATDYQFLANVRDAVGDLKGNGTGGKDASYNAASLLAQSTTNGTLNATGTDVGYTVELRISWSDLGVTPSAGNFMRIDPAIGDRDGDPPPTQGVAFDWAGLTTSFNNPSAWKDVQLVNPPPPADYDIARVSSMTVDGNLSDWAGVAAISMEDEPDNGRGSLNNTAQVRLAWNDTYLYAAYDVTDTELLAIQATRDHADLHQDDHIELYVDPQGDGAGAASMTATDYQFLANVRDAVGDLKGNGTGGKDASYNAASLLAKSTTNGTLNATGTDVGYTVELRIGWSDLGITPSAGHTMRMDLAVGDRDSSGPPPGQIFDWAGLTTTYNNPSAWKIARLATGNTPPGGGDILPVGLAGMDGHLRQGPGNDAGAPLYSVYHYNPHQRGLGNMIADIQWADENDVTLIWVTAGSPNSYGASSANGFNLSQYRANLNALVEVGGATLADAMARHVVLPYIADEPNHTKWNNSSGQNTFGPAMVNTIGREHKNRWPGCLTFMRILPIHLKEGWDQWSPLANYDAIDYAWVGHSGQHSRTDVTPLELWNDQLPIATALNMGLGFTLNIWDGGLDDDLDEVDACWDTRNNGSSNGVIVGTNTEGVAPGTHLTCAQAAAMGNALKNRVSSPAWIRRMINRVYDQPAMPFVTFWTYPDLGSLTPWAETLINRPDFVSALDYVIEKGKQRPSWIGYRTPKP